ncbi:hypothetical protein UNSWDHB_943 [Dehalobacter sp. UNSWDHB]|nr:glycosyl transferase, group 1/2 family protein [Dehalobacter sp. DCA]AFV05566.1 glycosyl transferase, group 1/2 family protein [Dehalobacter sp. CF]EQB21739.1 hypothetical protein UNSWDHB_943 [Dehalobacter sp. UNSWDHB]
MVNNIDLCVQVLEAVQTLSEASDYVMDLCRNGGGGFESYTSQMRVMLSALEEPLNVLAEEEPALTAQLFKENAEYSLERICKLYKNDRNRAAEKIEFELYPIICELYVDIYFYGVIYPDKEKILDYFKSDMPKLCPLPYAEQSEKNGEYKYELSIVVPAYNHLDTTIQCLNSLLQNIPEGLKFELILFNHGSSDGTQEYFESLYPTKQIDFKNNVKTLSVLGRVIEGKYFLFVSNDVIITSRSIENLLTCIKSDEKIGMAASVAPNISNLQSIPAEYQGIEELNNFAEKNNISDPFRWEQRVRLTPPVCIFSSINLYAYSFLGYGYIYQERGVAFGDDSSTMLLRRNGYRNLLCKDSYVHHFGSVTINDDIAKSKAKSDVYTIGRFDYRRIFGIDPWGTGYCYCYALMQALDPCNVDHTDILGINCGMGENSLHIRELLKQNVKNTNVTLYNVTDDNTFAPDLKSFSDRFERMDSLDDINRVFEGQLFDYIVIEDDFKKRPSPMNYLETLYARLKPGGKLAVCIRSKLTGLDIVKMEKEFCRKFGAKRIDGNDGTDWMVIEKNH